MTSSTAILPDEKIKIIDLPGHQRLRSHLLSQNLSATDGVVFFIDPQLNGNSQGIQTTAEHLHVLLSLIRTLEEKSNGKKPAVPVLLLLTKSDSWSSIQKQRAQDRVRVALERELEKRRKASSGVAAAQARLESIDELPSSGASNPFRFFSFFGSKQKQSISTSSVGGVKLPEDEQEILQSDVLDFDGPFTWDEEKLGINISWAISSAKETEKPTMNGEDAAQSDTDGTSGFRGWLQEKVL
jgi:signal recognition particle receptor subunit beta